MKSYTGTIPSARIPYAVSLMRLTILLLVLRSSRGRHGPARGLATGAGENLAREAAILEEQGQYNSAIERYAQAIPPLLDEGNALHWLKLAANQKISHHSGNLSLHIGRDQELDLPSLPKGYRRAWSRCGHQPIQFINGFTTVRRTISVKQSGTCRIAIWI